MNMALLHRTTFETSRDSEYFNVENCKRKRVNPRRCLRPSHSKSWSIMRWMRVKRLGLRHASPLIFKSKTIGYDQYPG